MRLKATIKCPMCGSLVNISIGVPTAAHYGYLKYQCIKCHQAPVHSLIMPFGAPEDANVTSMPKLLPPGDKT